jgi:DNA-binding CsgD family transcriptional regulator
MRDEADGLVSRLDVLIRLTAVGLIAGKSSSEAISLLGRSGLATDAIAEVVGTTPATVRATRSRNLRQAGLRND